MRIAALVGDHYHAPAPMIAALEASMDARSCTLAPYTDPAALPWGRLREYAALVVARSARTDADPPDAGRITGENERAIADYVAAGGALAALHAGLAGFSPAGPYADAVRGAFLFHPPEHPEYHVAGTGADHPALEGFRAFVLRDEMYFVRIDAARTTRLLEVSSPDYGTSTAAWAHAAGKGRVFCFTPGHVPGTLANPDYLAFLRAGLAWILGGDSGRRA